MSLLCLGDSNTFGYAALESGVGRFSSSVRWPSLVASGLSLSLTCDGLCGRSVSEYSVSGDLQILLASVSRLDFFLCFLGTNDLQESLGLSSEEIVMNIRNICSYVQNFSFPSGSVPKILILSPPLIQSSYRTSSFYPLFGEGCVEKSLQLASRYEALAVELDCAFLDLAHIPVSPVDGIHFTEEGHRILAEELISLLPRL